MDKPENASFNIEIHDNMESMYEQERFQLQEAIENAVAGELGDVDLLASDDEFSNDDSDVEEQQSHVFQRSAENREGYFQPMREVNTIEEGSIEDLPHWQQTANENLKNSYDSARYRSDPPMPSISEDAKSTDISAYNNNEMKNERFSSQFSNFNNRNAAEDKNQIYDSDFTVDGPNSYFTYSDKDRYSAQIANFSDENSHPVNSVATRNSKNDDYGTDHDVYSSVDYSNNQFESKNHYNANDIKTRLEGLTLSKVLSQMSSDDTITANYQYTHVNSNVNFENYTNHNNTSMETALKGLGNFGEHDNNSSGLGVSNKDDTITSTLRFKQDEKSVVLNFGDLISENGKLLDKISDLETKLGEQDKCKEQAISKIEILESKMELLTQQLQESTSSDNIRRIQDQHANVTKDLKTRHEQKMQGMMKMMENLKGSLESAKCDKQLLETKLKEAEKRYEKLIEEKDSYVTSLTEKIHSLKGEIVNLKIQEKNLLVEATEMKRQLDDIRSNHVGIMKENIATKAMEEIRMMQSKIEMLTKQLAGSISSNDLRVIQDRHTHAMKDLKNHYMQKIQTTTKTIEELKELLDSLKREKQLLQTEAKEVANRYEKLVEDKSNYISSSTELIQALKRDIANLQTREQNLLVELSNLKQPMEELKKGNDSLTCENRSLKDELQKLKAPKKKPAENLENNNDINFSIEQFLENVRETETVFNQLSRYCKKFNAAFVAFANVLKNMTPDPEEIETLELLPDTVSRQLLIQDYIKTHKNVESTIKKVNAKISKVKSVSANLGVQGRNILEMSKEIRQSAFDVCKKMCTSLHAKAVSEIQLANENEIKKCQRNYEADIVALQKRISELRFQLQNERASEAKKLSEKEDLVSEAGTKMKEKYIAALDLFKQESEEAKTKWIIERNIEYQRHLEKFKTIMTEKLLKVTQEEHEETAQKMLAEKNSMVSFYKQKISAIAETAERRLVQELTRKAEEIKCLEKQVEFYKTELNRKDDHVSEVIKYMDVVKKHRDEMSAVVQGLHSNRGELLHMVKKQNAEIKELQKVQFSEVKSQGAKLEVEKISRVSAICSVTSSKVLETIGQQLSD